ncbi:MAG TPA: DUF2490 domain-containing protein [Bryobacteraceae bacterium]|jgi:hypothetical protein|nr:DUF2490 domain-containing protein [Bryobacteraceae bacterium]
MFRPLFWFHACTIAVFSPLLAEDRRIDNNFNGWVQYFGDHPLGTAKWGVHLEAQWRRHDGYARWQQLLLRPGVNYSVNNKLMLTAGYAFIRSYQYGDFPAPARTNEHRIWEQALLRYGPRKASWSTRLRFENRLLGTYDAATQTRSWRFENRFRALQQIRVPITSATYFTAYDEIWFYVKPYRSASVLDQNRAYAALGYSLAPNWRVEVGYMNQAIWQRSGLALESNNTLMFVIISTAPFGK